MQGICTRYIRYKITKSRLAKRHSPHIKDEIMAYFVEYILRISMFSLLLSSLLQAFYQRVSATGFNIYQSSSTMTGNRVHCSAIRSLAPYHLPLQQFIIDPLLLIYRVERHQLKSRQASLTGIRTGASSKRNSCAECRTAYTSHGTP